MTFVVKNAERCLTHQPERTSVWFEPWDSSHRLIVLTVMKRDHQEEETFGRPFRRGRETRADQPLVDRSIPKNSRDIALTSAFISVHQRCQATSSYPIRPRT